MTTAVVKAAYNKGGVGSGCRGSVLNEMFLVLRNYLVMLLSQGSSTGLEERLREKIDSDQAQEVFEIDLDEDGPLQQE